VPTAPTLTSATGGNGSVALAWTAPSSDGGSALSGYQVWRATASGAETLLTPVPVSPTSYSDATVSNGTTYYYQVKAVNAVGPSAASNERSATPQAPPPTVARTGGTVSNFGSASSTAGSIAFSLPASSNALVAMVSLNSTSVTVTSMTWKPDPANPSQDQALTVVGRQVAPSGGAVEIWALLNPHPSTTGSALAHTLSANAKRVMGVHALSGVGSVGAPVGAGASGNAIGVTVPSVTGGLVLDVVYGQNSTTSYTAGPGQTEHWDTNTTSGLSNLRGTVSAARTQDPNSATSQFFVNLEDNAPLDASKDPGYTVFGRVKEGIQVVDAISRLPTGAVGPLKADVPMPLVVIKSIARLDEAALETLPTEDRDAAIRQRITEAAAAQSYADVLTWVNHYRAACGADDPAISVAEARAALETKNLRRAVFALEEYFATTDRSDPTYEDAVALYRAAVPENQLSAAAQLVEHGAADALGGEGLEHHALAGIEARQRIVEADHADLDQVVEFDVGWQFGDHLVREAAHQRAVLLELGVGVGQLALGGVHEKLRESSGSGSMGAQ